MKTKATHYQVSKSTISSPRGSGVTIALQHGSGERSFGELMRHFELPEKDAAARAYESSLRRVADILNQAAIAEALIEADAALDVAQAAIEDNQGRKQMLSARNAVRAAIRLL